jgi:hypothetical protein
MRHLLDVPKAIMPAINRFTIVTALKIGLDLCFHLVQYFGVIHNLGHICGRYNHNPVFVGVKYVVRPHEDGAPTLAWE